MRVSQLSARDCHRHRAVDGFRLADGYPGHLDRGVHHPDRRDSDYRQGHGCHQGRQDAHRSDDRPPGVPYRTG